MASWKVEGVLRTSGKDHAVIVEADSEQDAMLCARLEHDMMISAVQELDVAYPQPPRPVADPVETANMLAYQREDADRSSVYSAINTTAAILKVFGFINFAVAIVFFLLALNGRADISPGDCVLIALGSIISGVFFLGSAALLRLLVVLAADVATIAWNTPRKR